MKYISMLKEKKLWNAGYCQLYDFSLANSCEEARKEAVMEVVKVCRGDKEIKNPNLYNHLLTESAGKPGKIFQFIPTATYVGEINNDNYKKNVVKFGTVIDGVAYSNLRASYNDGNYEYHNVNSLKDFKVFKLKIPKLIVYHLRSHDMLSFMQQSERHCKLREYFYCDELHSIYVEGSKNFTDYDMICRFGNFHQQWDFICNNTTQAQFDEWNLKQKARQELLNKGSWGLGYTTIWVAGWIQDPYGFKNLFDVRLGDKGTQKEMRELVQAIKDIIGE